MNWDDGTQLYHHGIKGQKWGIRRFQNKNGSLTPAGKKRYNDDHSDDIVIKRGTKSSHISEKEHINLTNKETYLYNQSNPHDKKVYEGAYAMYIEMGKGYMDKYVHEYETLDDLRMPSSKKSVDLFIESYKKNPAPYVFEMNAMRNYYEKFKDDPSVSATNRKIGSYDKQYSKKTSEKDLREYGYDTFNSLSNYGSAGSASIRAFYKTLEQKGYNALVDDNNKGIYNDAVQPFIALNAKKTLKEIGVRQLTDDEMFDNLDYLEDYMDKTYKGKRRVGI